MEGTLELRKWFVGDMAHVRPERQGSAPGSDRSAFSVLAADTLKVDDFYIGAKAPGKSGRGTKQQPMLNSGRQGSCPLRCAKGCSKDCWRQVGHDQLCHTSKIRADGWSGKACRPLLVLRARLKGVRQSGRGCIPSHGPQGDIQLQGLREGHLPWPSQGPHALLVDSLS